MKTIIGLLLTLMTGRLTAQEIAGSVLGQNNESIINATVQVFQGGVLKASVSTDNDGRYFVKPLDIGIYDVLILNSSYDSFLMKYVVVTAEYRTSVHARLQRSHTKQKCTVTKWEPPLEGPQSIRATQKVEIPVAPIRLMETRNHEGLTPQSYRNDLQGINGIVQGKRHRPLMNATITIFHDGQIVGKTITNRSGDYVVMLNEPGFYDILVTCPHYDSLLAKGNAVTPGNNTTINANLRRAHRRTKCVTKEAGPILIDKIKMQ